jgi:hypothetical protein
MKKLLFIFAILVSFSAISTAHESKPRLKTTVTLAPPAYNAVYSSLKDSPTWRNIVLEVAIRVANEKYAQYYQSTDPMDIKRTAFAKKILSFKQATPDVVMVEIVNQVTNSSVISDLNDSYQAIDNIYSKLYNDFDLIGNITP